MKTSTAKLALITLLFSLAGLVGPSVRWLTWPSLTFERNTSSAVSAFVYDLVFLLWPTQSLAVMEVNTGPVIAGLAAIGANLLLFATVGMLTGSFARSRQGITLCYLAVVGLLLLLSLWGAGFSIAYLNVNALVVALVLYAIPFGLAVRYFR